MYRDFYSSPIGELLIEATDEAIVQLTFIMERIGECYPNQLTDLCKRQLNEYFKGERQTFDLPLELGGTAFQKSVWQALTTIPYGKQCSYSDIATKINNPKAVRAVGGANNKNQLPIVIPCHRVIGKSGKLVGYGGGIEKKEWLLNHEFRMINRS